MSDIVAWKYYDEMKAERDELLLHERQTHEELGAILGTDDNLVECAKRMADNNRAYRQALQVIASNTHCDWSARVATCALRG